MIKRNAILALGSVVIIVAGIFVWQYRKSASLAPLLGSNPATSDQTLSGKFASTSLGYSVRYPVGYTVNTSYTYAYQELNVPGKTIYGTKFTIPSAKGAGTNLLSGTNLSSDSGVSIETLPAGASSCTADQFLENGLRLGSTTVLTDNGVTYSVAKGGDAGAGNLYSEYLYAIPGTVPCTAVRYFIHSTQLGDYPPGTVTAFDKAALLKEFDGIRHSLVLTR